MRCLLGPLSALLQTRVSRRDLGSGSLWAAEDMAYDSLWSGADDLWPSETEIAPTSSEPELIVGAQFGLRLPNGSIVWNAWNNPPLVIPFDNLLDRLRMVANLQKTAADLGFVVDDFLVNYGWVTRNQIATVVYEDTGAYALTDPVVCGVSAPSTGKTPDHDDGSSKDDLSVPPAHLDRTIHPGPMGGVEGGDP